MLRQRNTKITVTLGPATSSKEMIEQLYLSGADIFRLNFSHGTHDDHAKRYAFIREIESKYERPVAIMVDLQGPKLRVGRFHEKQVKLQQGQTFRLDLDDKLGDEKRAQLPHPEIFAALEKGVNLLVDDGKIRLRVEDFDTDYANTIVEVAGTISDHKGVNVPGVELPISVITDKDLKDLEYGLKLGADFIALSFVQKPEDIIEARELIKGRAKILAKLEKPQAIKQLDEIIRLADGVLVARGDLGVEMPPEDVPSLQKMIIRGCRKHGRPVLVATQMLDSMVKSPTPTRAEASDVATAVYDGADAVMLSAESASGDYPVESVQMMERIISRVEQDDYYREALEANPSIPESTVADAITMAAHDTARTVGAKAIVTFTASGSTTQRASRERPEVPILALTSNIETARHLVMSWGVHPVLCEEVLDFFQMSLATTREAKRFKLADTGDLVVITAGVPYKVANNSEIFVAGTTNLLRILEIEV